MKTSILTSLKIFSLVLVSMSFLRNVFSATLTLDKIGNLDLQGKVYPQWWYTGIKPTLYGKATPSQEITITVSDKESKINSDSSGNWSYLMDLDKGDYEVKIVQGSDQIITTIHLGQVVPENLSSSNNTEQSTTSVPVTGYNQIVALSFGLGVILLASYFYILDDTDKKSLLKARIIKED